MSAGTTAQTSSPHIKQVVGCANGVSWTMRQEINPTDLTTIQTLYINNATQATQVAAPAGFVPVACETGKDSEWAVLCDTSTTPPTPYLRRIITDFSTVPPTDSTLNFTLNGAAYTPTTPGVCEGYDLVEGCAEVFNTTSGLLTPVRSLQLTRYGVLIGTPIFYSNSSNTVVTPTGTDRVVNCGEIAYTESLLCDSATPPVAFWRTQYKLGSTVLLTQDLNIGKTAAFTPTGAVGVCQNNNVEEEYACIAGAASNDDTISIRIVRVYNGSTLISETRTRTDTYATVPNNAVLVPCTQAAGTVRQGSLVSTGAAAVTIPAGKRSISIVVRSGSVTGTGSLQTGATQYRAGEGYSWSIKEDGELLEAMTFTGNTATTSFTVIWTQRA
jgi:hypothetical protein